MLEIFAWSLAALLGLVWLGIVAFGPPYVPTLASDIETVMKKLKIGARDHVVDLGCGDGKILLACAKRGARASGVELNPFLVWVARFRTRLLAERVDVQLGDMWRYELPEDTSHVFVFFADRFMPKLKQYVAHQRQTGRKFRLVSYGFMLPGEVPTDKVGAFNIYDF